MNRLGVVAFIGFVFVCALEAQAAATVTYTLQIDTSASTWSLFGQSSTGDNAGISLWGASLNNVNFPVTIDAPNLKYLDQTSTFHAMGFAPAFAETNSTNPIGSLQEDVIVYGFGQTAGMLTLPSGDTFLGARQPTYAAELLLADGTYSGDAPSFKPGGSPTDFPTQVFNIAEDATFFTPSLQFSTITVPEPSLGLLLAPLSVLIRRRTKSAK